MALSFSIPSYLKNEFSIEELEQMKEQFDQFDESGDGSIDAEELHEIMEKMGISIAYTQLKELVDQVDDNKSGALEFDEFVKLISNMRRGNGGILSQFIQNSKHVFKIKTEMMNLQNHPNKKWKIVPIPGDGKSWYVDIEGPLNTPYENGVFRLEIIFGNDYPYQAPEIQFLTRLYHVNFTMRINGTCSIRCILSQWTSGWTIYDILLEILKRMKQPNHEEMNDILYENTYIEENAKDCNGTTCQSFGIDTMHKFVHKPEEYNQFALEFTKRFARG